MMVRLTPTVLVVSLACCIAEGCSKHVVINPGVQSVPAPAPVGPTMYSGPWKPPPETGQVGDYFLDIPDSAFYGPKTVLGWGTPDILPSQPSPGVGGDCVIYTGYTPPLSSVGNLGDYYMDLGHGVLYGPKVTSGWTTQPNLGTTPAAPPPQSVN